MPVAVDWITDHLPTDEGEDGSLCVRWTNSDGYISQASVAYVAEKFGPAIEQAISGGTDVLDLVLAAEFDEGWHDIWRRWRELGFV